MASPAQVKAYVACWLQMGKAVDVDRFHCRYQLTPDSVLAREGYSAEFERHWRFMYRHADFCYLSGTSESIADLLKTRWEIAPCSRCQLLLPLPAAGAQCMAPCPCADVGFWPNLDTLQPRMAPFEEIDEGTEPAPTGIDRVVRRLEAVTS